MQANVCLILILTIHSRTGAVSIENGYIRIWLHIPSETGITAPAGRVVGVPSPFDLASVTPLCFRILLYASSTF